jgi:hypothetical protein
MEEEKQTPLTKVDEEKQTLLTKVNDEAEALYKAGRISHTTDLICSYASIIGSALATIFAGTGLFLDWVPASIAAIPGVCTGLQRVADFRGRSSWYFLQSTDHEVLSHNLEFGNLPVKDAAREFGAIKKKWQESWNLHVKSGIATPEKV